LNIPVLNNPLSGAVVVEAVVAVGKGRETVRTTETTSGETMIEA